MYCTGIADEAADDALGQIEAHRRLGWDSLEVRAVEGKPVHELDEVTLERVAGAFADANMRVCGIGSIVANWGRQINDPFEDTLRELDATLNAAKVLKAPMMRIMSYAVLKDRPPADQMVDERVRRLTEIVARCRDAGVAPVHENCMNYGGMGWKYTLELVERVPGLELVYDTGNPVFATDWNEDPPGGRQSSWEFYAKVRHAVTHVHVKDANWNEEKQQADFCWPGDGDGDVAGIVADLAARGYEGGLSIEPHMGAVFHDPDAGKSEPMDRKRLYIEYGKRLEGMVKVARGV